MSRTLMICLLATLAATPALAQAPAPANGDITLGGPQIPGLCLLSQQAVFANAKVGLAATARLQQLTQQSQAEISGENQSLEAEVKALEAQRGSLKPAALKQRQQSIAERYKALKDKAALRGREIEATRVKALDQITAQERPLIAEAYKARGCGLLFDRNSVLGGNLAGDLTLAVVQSLDAKITTISFDLETLPPAP